MLHDVSNEIDFNGCTLKLPDNWTFTSRYDVVPYSIHGTALSILRSKNESKEPED